MSVWRGSISVSRDALTHLAPSSAAVMTAIIQLMTGPPAQVCVAVCVFIHVSVCVISFYGQNVFVPYCSPSFQMLMSACCLQLQLAVCSAVLTLLGASTASVLLATAFRLQTATAKVSKHPINITLNSHLASFFVCVVSLTDNSKLQILNPKYIKSCISKQVLFTEKLMCIRKNIK